MGGRTGGGGVVRVGGQQVRGRTGGRSTGERSYRWGGRMGGRSTGEGSYGWEVVQVVGSYGWEVNK